MKKKMKVIIGICLIAALAVGSVGRYAQAASMKVFDAYGDTYEAECISTIGTTSGSAHTASVGTIYGYCSVNVSCTWKKAGGDTLYYGGNGAGGMHGASVTISHNKNADEVFYAETSATHTFTETVTNRTGSLATMASWTK